MLKKRKLKDINLREISYVDKPASKRSFLLLKQDGKSGVDSLLKAKKKINIEIASDGTVGGTSITINGDKVDKMKSFNFSFWEGEDAKAKVSASYSTMVENVDGFQRTETYYLSKGEIKMDKRIEKLLKKFFGDENIKFEKMELNEETIVNIEKAIEIINGYREEFPEDLTKAVALISVCAGQGYEQKDLEKAGAKLSKDTIAKVQALVAAAKALESILPKETDKDGKPAEKSENPELQKMVETLTKSMSDITAKLEKKETSDQLTQVIEQIKDVGKRLKAVESKPASTKKGITDEGDPNDNKPKGAGEKGKVLWPSLVGGTKEE